MVTSSPSYWGAKSATWRGKKVKLGKKFKRHGGPGSALYSRIRRYTRQAKTYAKNFMGPIHRLDTRSMARRLVSAFRR